MNRRVLFTAVAALALIAGAVPLGGLGVTAVAHALAPRPTETAVTATRAATPDPAASTGAASPASPAAGSDPSALGLSLADRLRPLAAGDQLVSTQQLKDFARDYRNAPTAEAADEWAAEAAVEVKCMSDAGFYWDPRETSTVMTDPSQPVVPVGPAARLALDGNAGMPYHWQDAGCRGLAIHEKGTGN